MNKIDLKKMESVQGGDAIEGVCIGVGVGTAVLAAANIWNPGGWVIAGVTVSCGLYTIFK